MPLKFIDTPLAGAYLIEPAVYEDERGFFSCTFTEEEFAARGLTTRWAQCARSYNRRRGTLRGMHYQREPYAEVKLVACTVGVIYDVILDLRPGSATFGRWFGTELSRENRRMIYIPQGFAHGYQTLEDDCETAYQMSAPYRADHATGVRWNDPAFGIRWPLPVSVLSDRDASTPDYQPPAGS